MNKTTDFNLNDSFTVYDNEFHLVLPNLKMALPSKSYIVSTDIFTNYLDDLLINIQDENVCKFSSNIISEYFISIDFTKYEYKIPLTFQEYMKGCEMTHKRFLILPILLTFKKNLSHVNVVLIDYIKQTIELFEPHGDHFISNTNIYDVPRHIKKVLEITNIVPSLLFTFVNVQENIMFGVQALQNTCNPASGVCVAWVLIFIVIKLLNPATDTDYIVKYLLSHTPRELDQYVSKFIGYLELYYNKSNNKIYRNIEKYEINFSKHENILIGNQVLNLLDKINTTNLLDFENTMQDIKPYFEWSYFNVVLLKFLHSKNL